MAWPIEPAGAGYCLSTDCRRFELLHHTHTEVPANWHQKSKRHAGAGELTRVLSKSAYFHILSLPRQNGWSPHGLYLDVELWTFSDQLDIRSTLNAGIARGRVGFMPIPLEIAAH
jgi:hypothetical protein